MDLRTLLAALLGAVLGLLLVAYPELVIRVHTAGRLPNDRGGSYGEETVVPDRWRRVVQGVGVIVFLMALYFGATLVGV